MIVEPAALRRRAVVVALLALAPGGCGDGPQPGPDGAPDRAPDAGATAAAGPADTDVWIAPLVEDGDGLALMEARNLTDRPGYDNQPSFVDGGGALLYTAVDEAGQADTWRWDRASDEIRPVTRTAPESEYSPTPLPGGGGFSAVRVEADSTQRLWRFDEEGGDARPVLEDVAPVGYHAWLDATHLALFVLGDPPTLRIADTETGEARTVAEDIGRSLNAVPGREGVVSWVQRKGEGMTRVMLWSLAEDRARPLVETPDGGQDHAWTPAGTLLMASGGRLLAWREGWDGWRTVADLGPLGLTLSRLAVSPDGDLVAFVAERLSAP